MGLDTELRSPWSSLLASRLHVRVAIRGIRPYGTKVEQDAVDMYELWYEVLIWRIVNQLRICRH